MKFDSPSYFIPQTFQQICQLGKDSTKNILFYSYLMIDIDSKQAKDISMSSQITPTLNSNFVHRQSQPTER